MGGGFGAKNFLYPESVLVLWAARRLGRPVKWVSDRSKAFLTDVHGRDHVTRAELALDADGRFTGLRIRTVANMGGYLSAMSPLIPTNASWVVMGGAYAIPSIFLEVDGVFTNTVPVDAYRGTGRPEVSYVIERLVDIDAAELGVEANTLRRKNFISQFPFRTAFGLTVDTGAFEENLDRALDMADAAGFEERCKTALVRGRLRGLGLSSYLEITLGPPDEATEIRFDDDGVVTLTVGTHSNGQGHQTLYIQMACEHLGIPPDRVRFVQADTALVASGGGHGGSRTTGMGGNSMLKTAGAVRAKAEALAAHLLDAGDSGVVFADGLFTVAGTNRGINILEISEAARNAEDLPGGIDATLTSREHYEREGFNFPNGCHAAEVEIDPETGVTRLVGYAIVDDFGTVMNPLLAAGQAMVGTAQGIGQALLEHTVFDTRSGQLLSGSFMDYTIPRADDLPDLNIELNQDARAPRRRS